MNSVNIWLVIIFLYSGVITYLCSIYKDRNAWDVLFFNSTLAIFVLALFFFYSPDDRILKSTIAISLGVVATAEKIAGVYIKKSNNK